MSNEHLPVSKKNVIHFPYKVPEEIKRISDILHEEGIEAFLVGGSVRDMVMEHTPNDFDFASPAKPKDLIPILEKNGIEYDDRYIDKVDYLIAIVNGVKIDFKTYTGGSLESYLSSFDFTFNALAYDIQNENILEFFDGINDIKNKTVRTVRIPTPDDAGIFFRAIRFTLEFGFKIEKESYKLLKDNIENLGEFRHSTIIKGLSTIYNHCEDSLT